MSIDHRAEAARLVDGVLNNPEMPVLKDGEGLLTAALVHATLARDEEQAARTADMQDALRLLRAREYDVRKLVSTHIAQALASREPKRWKAGRDLAQALDQADCNMDADIDAHLADDGWDPRSAWKAVSTIKPGDDPWAPKPDVTDDIPQPVRRALVEYLAAALLSKGDAQGVGQTITFALKAAGADLTGDIEKQISSIALGRDPAEPPF